YPTIAFTKVNSIMGLNFRTLVLKWNVFYVLVPRSHNESPLMCENLNHRANALRCNTINDQKNSYYYST
ncbi:MAG: hypothetical protein RSC87_01270, partial [Muribaculaceae bacterium]